MSVVELVFIFFFTRSSTLKENKNLENEYPLGGVLLPAVSVPGTGLANLAQPKYPTLTPMEAVRRASQRLPLLRRPSDMEVLNRLF